MEGVLEKMLYKFLGEGLVLVAMMPSNLESTVTATVEGVVNAASAPPFTSVEASSTAAIALEASSTAPVTPPAGEYSERRVFLVPAKSDPVPRGGPTSIVSLVAILLQRGGGTPSPSEALQ